MSRQRLAPGSLRAYMATMVFRNSPFFRDVAPRRAIAEVIAYVREPRAYRRTFLLLACIPFALLFTGFYLDGLAKNVPPPPTIIYVESWPLSRSLAEVKAAQIERQAAKDAALARRAELYRTLGQSLGMDTEKLEREAVAIREKARSDARTGVRDAGQPSVGTPPEPRP